MENLEQMKAKYEASPEKWDVYAFHRISNKWKSTDNSLYVFSSIDYIKYKLILKEHSLIAQAVIENPDVEVEFEHSPNGEKNWWVEDKLFFKYYNYKLNYRLVEQYKPDVDTLQINSMEDLNNLPIVGEDTISIADESGKVYGFEKPEFECELYAIRIKFTGDNEKPFIIGVAKSSNGWHMQEWRLDGISAEARRLNLTPIKPKWYEDESNFPAMIVRGRCPSHPEFPNEASICWRGEYFENALEPAGWKLATKAERDSLYCGEE